MSRHNNSGALTALKRLLPDGTLDPDFAPNQLFANGPHTTVPDQGSEVNAILVNEDGSFYIGGVFENYGAAGTSRSLVAKVNADGTLNTDFVPPFFGSNGAGRYVQSLALDGQGGLLVSGAFAASGKHNLVRLNAATGGVDNGFDANATLAGNTKVVDCVCVANDGRIYVSGTASSFPMVKRLLSGGQEDNAFNVLFTNDYGRVNRILALPNGRVILGGGYDLQGRPQGDFISAHTSTGALDPAFMTNLGTSTNGWVGGLLRLMPDGRILAGGIFNTFNGSAVASLAILNADGSRDTAFTPVPYSNDRNSYVTHMYDAVMQPDGKIVAGGWFRRITDPDLDISNIVRFEGDAAVGPGSLKFASASYSVLENAGTAKVQVARVGGISGAVSINYATGGGGSTAVAGTDYTTTSGTLTWADGEGGAKTISIPITNNATAAAAKTLRVALSGIAGGATLGTPDQTVITLLDDDSPPSIVTPPASVTLNQGATLRLSVVPDSPLPVTYQWQFDSGSGFANINGATSRELIIAQVTPEANAGQYRVQVTNSNGSNASVAATVVVNVPAGSVIPVFNANATNAVVKAVYDDLGRILTATSGTITVLRRNANGSLDGGFNAPVFSSTLTDLLPLPDGKILVAGFFDTVGGVARKGLARLNADGTLDTGFNLNLTHYVQSVGLSSAGSFYVGGTSGQGELKRYLANGTVDAAFAPSAIGVGIPNGSVWAIRENGDGTLFVAHQVSVGIGNTTYALAKLNVSNGSAAPGFTSPSLQWNIYDWDFLPDGRIVIGGRFSQINGVTYNRVAILNADGSVDSSFNVGTGPNGPVRGVKYLNGRILAWGEFTQYNGGSPRALVRLNLEGSLDESFVIGTGAGSNVNSMLLTAEGDMMIFGAFTSFNGVARSYIAKLVGGPQSVGFEPTAYTVVEDNTTVTLTVRRYGSATGAASVEIETVDGTAVVNTDYTPAFGTLTWADGDSSDRTVQVTLLDNATPEATRSFKVRLVNPLGDIMPAAPATITILDDDTPVTFTVHPAATTTRIAGEALTLTAAATSPTAMTYQWYLNGKPVAGATTATLNIASITQAQAGLYTLVATNAAGSFSSNSAQVIVTLRSGLIASDQATSGRPLMSNNQARVIQALPDGGALLGGNFFANAANNINQAYLIRIRPDGSTDTSFSLTLDNYVSALYLQPDGKILVGGAFTSPSTRWMRLNADLTPDTAFNANLDSFFSTGQVSDFALDSSGRIYAAPSSGVIARYSATGVRDTDYATPSFGNTVYAIAIQSDDKLLVGGAFTSPANRLMRLNTNGTADSSFTASGSVSINDLLVLRDGRIFAGGGTGSGLSLALISDTGSFSTITSGSLTYQLSQAPNGKVVVARSSVSGSGSVYRIKATNPLPSPTSNDIDTTFNVGAGPTADVKAVSHGADGSIWLAGNFNNFDGIYTGNVVKLIGDPRDPGIVNPPVRVGVNAGAAAQFSVGAVGTNLTYQWLKNGVALVDDGRISGATGAVLTVGNVGAADDDTYTVEVTGGSPSATVASAPVRLHLLGAPVVVASPGDVAPAIAATLTLEADVLAATPATYEWRRDGVLIVNGGRYSGAHTDTLVIANANNSDDGSYVLTVTNGLGSASTTAAVVAVNQPPADRDITVSARTSSGSSGSNYVNGFIHLPDGRTLIAARGTITGTNAGGGTANVASQVVVVDVNGNISSSPAGDFSGGTGVNGFFAQADGKILVYGTFISVGGTGGAGRAGLTRLNADLTLDTSFVPPATFSTVNAVAQDTAGRIYVAGPFAHYAGQSGYSYLVRLSADGTLDTTFKPGLNSTVLRLEVQPDGKILVAGGFASYNPSGTPVTVPGLMRFLADGSVDSGFTAALPAGSNVQAVAVDASGRITVSSSSTPYTLLRLLPSGGVDSSFNFTESLNANASVLLAQADGKVIVGGSFTTPTNRLFRVNADGSLDTSFDVGTGFNSGAVTSIAPDLKGRLWVGGTGFNQYKGVTANRMLVLLGTGPVLQLLTQPASRVVDVGTAQVQLTAAATGNNGFTYQWKKNGTPITDGGRFSGATTDTLTLQNIALTDAATYTVTVTSPSASLTSQAAALTVLSVPEITQDPAAQVVVMGANVTFTSAATGAATLSYQWLRFGSPVSNGSGVSGATTPVLTITGADFTHVGDYSLRVSNGLGSDTSAVANLTVERRPGALAADRIQPTFNGGNNDVDAIHIYPDGSYLVAGGFTQVTINGVVHNRGRIARFLPDGSLDPNFTPSFSHRIYALAVDSAGRIFVGGEFTSVTIGSTNTNVSRVARLTAAGALDTAFDTSTTGPKDGSVKALAPLDNGSVYVGGSFTMVGTVTSADVRSVVRLSANGSLDTGFKSQINQNGVVNALMRRGNKLLIGAQNNAWGASGQGVGVLLVSATGARDTGYASPPGIIPSFGLHFNELADGSIFAGQNGPSGYGQRYHATNGAVLGFNPNPGRPVYASAQQSDGKLLVGGEFYIQPAYPLLGFANRLYRASVDGTVDTGFDVGAGFDSTVKALAVDAQGRIYVGGSFTTLNGQTQDRFAILTGGEFESRNGRLPSQTITFAAPTNRTFNPAANTFVVSPTSSSGLPVSVAVTSGPATINGNTVTITGAGEVTLTATQAGNASFAAATPVSHTFTVAKAAQSITFATLSDRSMASQPFDLTATASSGLTVSFELVSGPASLNGTRLTLNGTAGTVVLRASQAGDANWQAATPVERSFQALDIPPEPEPQSITFAPIADRTVEDGPLVLAATASSGLTVSFELVSGPATLDGQVLTPTGPSGTVTVRAVQAGDSAWLAANSVTRSFFIQGSTPVVPVAQSIVFVTPASRYLDEETILLEGYSSSGLPLVYEVSGPATVSGNLLTLTDVGTVTVTATQPGNAQFLAAKAVVRKIKVLATPSALALTNLVQTYDGTPRSVGYTGVEEGTEVTITYAGSETPPINAGKYAVVAQAGSVKKTGSLVINKAPVYVKANDQRRLANTENPELTLTYSGFLGADSELTVFNDPAAKPAVKPPVVSTTAKTTSAGGQYPIKAAGAVAVNYVFIYTNGTLTVDGFGGGYEALLTHEGQPAAKLELTVVPTSASFSGKLTVPGELAALPVKGSLSTDEEDETATGTATVKKGTNEYTLSFTLPLEGEFTATLSGAATGSTNSGKELRVLAKGEKLAFTGAHTVVLASALPTGDDVPQGAGYAIGTIDAKGGLKLAGKLADGTTLTAALAGDVDTGYRLFVLPYKRLGSYVAGNLPLTDHPDVEGRKLVAYADGVDLVWTKAEGAKDKLYRAGFGPVNTRMTLDPWLPPAKASKTSPAITLGERLGLDAGGTFEVAYSSFTSASFGDLASEALLDAKGKVVMQQPETLPANVSKWNASFTANTGAFKGSFTLTDEVPAPTSKNPEATKLIKRVVPFAGVLRQPPGNDMDGLMGAGYFLLPALPTDDSNEQISHEIQLLLPEAM